MISLVCAAVVAVGPGLGNLSYNQGELFAPVGFIESPQGHGNVTMVQGYLMVITSSDGGGSATDGAIEFWDVSNPRAPSLVVRHESADTFGLREAHGFSLAWHGDDMLVLAAQGIDGIQLWDVTDPLDIALLSYLDLPGIQAGDYSGDWWVFWQAPWLYVAGVDSGLLVVDARDPAAPALARSVSTGDMAGVSPAQVFVVGNLLVAMESQSRAFATLDVSVPDQPRVLRRMDGKPGYSHIFAGDGKIITSGNIPPRVHVHQVDAGGNISFVSTFALYFNSGGYGSLQDGFFHSGFSDQYVKFDLAAAAEVGSGSSGRADRDEDFATVIGNLVFAGDDHGEGTALIAHQTAPDTSAPVVQWMHPPASSPSIAPTSRIGLSFSDHIDAASLTPASVRLEDDAGAVVAVQRSAQMGLVNLAPLAPLEPLRSYRVVVDGVRDLAGNVAPFFEATLTVGDGSGAVVDPADVVSALETNSPFGEYAVLTFGTGALTYVDRDFAFSAAHPARLDGMPYIQTRNNDKLGFSADFVRFTLALDAEVLVLYDVRAGSPPDWLDAFTATGEVVSNDDTSYDVYTRAYAAGPVVLGGNSAAGSSGTESMYSVVIVPEQLSCSLALAPALAGDAVPLTVQGPDDAQYDWQVGGAVLPNAGRTVTAPLAPGRVSVVVTATRGPQTVTCTGVQIVHRPLVSAPATSSAQLVWHQGRAITVNPDAGTVSAVSETGVAYEVAVGAHPVSLAVRPAASELWVLSRDGARIDVVDAGDGGAIRQIALPRASRPAGIVFDASGARAYVSLSALGEVTAIDAASGSVVEREAVVPTAGGLTFFDGKLYVSRFISSDAGGEVVVVDAASLAIERTITLGIDAGPDTEASGRGVPNYLSPLRISADGSFGVVSGKKDNIERGLFREDRALTFESRVRAFVATVDIAAGSELVELRRDINDRDMVQATALSRFGDVVFVASQGGNVVDVFETASGRRVSQFAVEKAPQGIAIDDESGRVAVQNMLSRSVSVFDASALLAGRANHVTPLGVVVSVADEALSEQVLRGKRLFYDAADRRISKDGYLSCASCHLDGGHDGRTWDFTQAGEGLRNTITLHGRGGVELMGRVHWTANFDEIQDFENDIRNAFGGTGLLSDEDFALTSDPLGAPKAGRSADLDALAAYVTSLRAVPPSPYRREDDGKLTQEARRGRALFIEAACNECHAGAAFSDGAKHDVATQSAGSGLGIGQPLEGVGFDTPTLKGIWDSAPYLHDGSAADVGAALDKHGALSAAATAALADGVKRADLVAYLLQLDETSSAPEEDCATRDECVEPDVVDPGDDDDDDGVPPAPPPTPPGVSGCGCSADDGAGALDVTFGIAWALFIVSRLRRRRR